MLIIRLIATSDIFFFILNTCVYTTYIYTYGTSTRRSNDGSKPLKSGSSNWTELTNFLRLPLDCLPKMHDKLIWICPLPNKAHLNVHSQQWLPCSDICGTLMTQESFYLQRFPDSKVHGANMGPIWGRQDPGRSHVGPMNFAILVNLL